MPKGLDSFLFVTTGSEAVEAAVKLARRGVTQNGSIRSDQTHEFSLEDRGRWKVRVNFLGLHVCISSFQFQIQRREEGEHR